LPLLGMYQGQDFGMQSLTIKKDRVRSVSMLAVPRVIGSVSDQREARMRRLDANLMLQTSFKAQPEFGNETIAPNFSIFFDDLEVSDRLLRSKSTTRTFSRSPAFGTSRCAPLLPLLLRRRGTGRGGSLRFRRRVTKFHLGHPTR